MRIHHLIPAIFMAGCMFETDSDPNQPIKVFNETRRPVEISYPVCLDSGWYTFKQDTIAAHHAIRVRACRTVPLSPGIFVTYDERWTVYEFRPEIWDQSGIHIREEDFTVL